MNIWQIIVATPGRLLDHIENRSGLSLRLMRLKMLVLDEADYLLDLGFRNDMEKIVDCLPRQRQSLLFSATIPKEVTFSLPFIQVIKLFIFYLVKPLKYYVLDNDYAGSPDISTCFEKRTCLYRYNRSGLCRNSF